MFTAEPPPRFPTWQALQFIADQVGIPYEPAGQDWEYTAADPEHIDTYLKIYEDPHSTDDVRFAVMEMLLQAFEDVEGFASDTRWTRATAWLRDNHALHAYTIWYWSALEAESIEDAWNISPYMRLLL